ncbi:MAG TPA: hypothetical protein VNV38_07380 [Stellaceae bacterium]|jgi:hypothetical protein|nr:hypothetical protein [Stellaceae bacterium]
MSGLFGFIVLAMAAAILHGLHEAKHPRKYISPPPKKVPNKIRWKDSDIEVIAIMLPKYFWITSLIEVRVDGQSIIKAETDSREWGEDTKEFRLNGETHSAALLWVATKGVHGPYRLSIDGQAVLTSVVTPRNWPMRLIPLFAMGMAAATVIVGIAYAVDHLF